MKRSSEEIVAKAKEVCTTWLITTDAVKIATMYNDSKITIVSMDTIDTPDGLIVKVCYYYISKMQTMIGKMSMNEKFCDEMFKD